MSNEELVEAIRTGEASIEKLWDQIAGLVKWKALHVAKALEGRGGAEFEDFYQSGYLAMVAAVDSYKPERGAFASWFMYHLKNAFAETAGYRTKAGKNEPLNNYISLDIPLTDNTDSNVLRDIIADPTGEIPQQMVDERIYYAAVTLCA